MKTISKEISSKVENFNCQSATFCHGLNSGRVWLRHLTWRRLLVKACESQAAKYLANKKEDLFGSL